MRRRFFGFLLIYLGFGTLSVFFVSCGNDKKAAGESPKTDLTSSSDQSSGISDSEADQNSEETSALNLTPPEQSSPQQTSQTKAEQTSSAVSSVTSPGTSVPPTIEEVIPASPTPIPRLSLAIFPQGGLFLRAPTIKIDARPPQVQVRYSLDGSDPKEKGLLYSGQLTVSQSSHLRVYVSLPGAESVSDEARFTVGELAVAPGGNGNGSLEAPLGSLTDAFKKATEEGFRAIKVQSGTYEEVLKINLPFQISGGWNEDFTRQTGKSVVSGQQKNMGTVFDPAATLTVDGGGGPVRLDFLDLRGSDGAYVAGLSVKSGGLVVLRKSSINGGFGSSSYGIYVSGNSSIEIFDCDLLGGEGSSTYAFHVSGSRFKVQRTLLRAGKGNAVSTGLSSAGGRGTISSSVLDGGEASSSYGAALYASPGIAIYNCTILGGRGNNAHGILLSETESEIVNSIIGAQGKLKSYGIFENYPKSSPKRLEANVFFSSNSGIYYDATLKLGVQIPDSSGGLQVAGGIQAGGGNRANVVANPVFGPAPGYKSLAGNPTSIISGGLNLGELAPNDFDGNPRTEPWSIGAYELR